MKLLRKSYFNNCLFQSHFEQLSNAQWIHAFIANDTDIIKWTINDFIWAWNYCSFVTIKSNWKL